MRNLPIDAYNLGIFLNKQGHSFQFPKKKRAEEASHSPLTSESRKKNFVNELMEVWRTLSTCWKVVKIWAILITNFHTCSIKCFISVFKALLALDSLNTWIKFWTVKHVVPQMFVKTIFFMTFMCSYIL